MRRTTIAIALAGFVLLGPAAAAHASTTAQGLTCAKASVHFTQTGLASFASSTTGEPCTVQLSSWSVPDTYDGKGYDASAKPQVLVDRTIATLTGDTQTVSVKVPSSRWCQIDYRAAGGTYLYGRIVECHPVAVVHPKPPVVTPPKHVTPPAHHVTHVAHLPKVLAFTASPFDLSKYAEGGVAALLLGVGLIVATRRRSQS